jgi:putative membrane protein
MRILALSALLSSVAIPAAIAQEAPMPKPTVPAEAETTPANDADTAGNSENLSPAVAGAAVYANNAAYTDMYEIESANLAWKRANSEEVKTFARMLIADHTGSSAKLAVLVDHAEGELPSSLDDRHQKMIDELEAADDAAFTQLFLDQQMKAHEEGLKLHSDYAESGEIAEFKMFAADNAKVVKHHLDMVTKLGGKKAARAQ